MANEKAIRYWHRQLDKIRILMQNAQEEYEQYLNEFEAECGAKEREKYEEAHV